MNLYHKAALIAHNVENGEGFRSQLYASNLVENKKDLPQISFLVNNALQKKEELDDIISKTELIKDLKKKDIWLCRILVTELVLGRKSYRPECPVMKKVYQKKSQLKKVAADMKITKKTVTQLPRYVRVDTNSVTMSDVHKYLKETGKFELVQSTGNAKSLPVNSYRVDEHVPALLAFHAKAAVHELDWVVSGKLILQDKSSCLVAPLLSPHPGSTILDMCAAPGFKTQHVATLTHDLGKIIAVDKNTERFNALCQLKEKFELSTLTCINLDSLKLPSSNDYENVVRSVEYILLDPPCSGSGMAKNYDYDPKANTEGGRFSKLRNLQAKMLRSALTDYPAARRVTYSTCSISEEENESVIDEFLNDTPGGFTLVDLTPFYPGLSRGRSNYSCGSKCIRLSPETDGTNGFFIAMFERLNPPAYPDRLERPSKGQKRAADSTTSTVSKKKKQRTEMEEETSSSEDVVNGEEAEDSNESSEDAGEAAQNGKVASEDEDDDEEDGEEEEENDDEEEKENDDDDDDDDEEEDAGEEVEQAVGDNASSAESGSGNEESAGDEEESAGEEEESDDEADSKPPAVQKKSKSPKTFENKREGDWTCTNADCGNSNFAWRKQCFKCNENAPEGAGGAREGSVQRREGDWTCGNSNCGNSNFAWRTQCFRCNEDKPEGAGDAGAGDGNGSGRSREFWSQGHRKFGQGGRDNRGRGGGFRGRGGDRGGRGGDRGGRGGFRGGRGGDRRGRGGFRGGRGGDRGSRGSFRGRGSRQ